jgi:hypothetical protein
MPSIALMTALNNRLKERNAQIEFYQRMMKSASEQIEYAMATTYDSDASRHLSRALNYLDWESENRD